MRNQSFKRFGVAAASVAFFAACHSSQAPFDVEPGTALSANEAAAINQELVALAFGGWDFGQATPSPAQAPAGGDGVSASFATGVPISIDWSLGVSTQCDQGGTFDASGAITGSIDDQTLAGNLTLDITTSMTDCAFTADQTIVTFNTNPDLQLNGSTAWNQAGLVGSSTYTYAGGLDWSAADGRSGSCTFDVVVTLAQDGTQTATGTVCNRTVDSGTSA